MDVYRNVTFGEYFLKISVHKNSKWICYKFLKKHSIKVDLHGLNPGNVHLNNLNAPILSVLIWAQSGGALVKEPLVHVW